MLVQNYSYQSHVNANPAGTMSTPWQVCEFNSNDCTPEGIKTESGEVGVV
jgi:hypothetical protein